MFAPELAELHADQRAQHHDHRPVEGEQVGVAGGEQFGIGAGRREQEQRDAGERGSSLPKKHLLAVAVLDLGAKVADLAGRGVEALAEPMLTIEPSDDPVGRVRAADPEAEAIILTSRQTVAILRAAAPYDRTAPTDSLPRFRYAAPNNPDLVRDEERIEAIVARVRARAAQEGGQPDVIEAIYRSTQTNSVVKFPIR